MLISTRDQIETEIYAMLVKMGVDPDEFDPNTPLSGDGFFTGERQRTQELIASLQRIKEKIAELS